MSNLTEKVYGDPLDAATSESRICGGCGSEIHALGQARISKMNEETLYFCSARCNILFTRMVLKMELFADHFQATMEARERRAREEAILLSV